MAEPLFFHSWRVVVFKPLAILEVRRRATVAVRPGPPTQVDTSANTRVTK